MAYEISSGDILDLESVNSNKKIYAGPGAGKTYFLVNNIKDMFKKETKIYRSESKKILCITYTNSAVEEIKSRLEGYEKNIEICTIHSFIIKYIIYFCQEELKRIMKEDYDIEVKGKARISSQIEGV
ncbi:MAG: UvrD-helicase domain-containing protein [Clostridia bacterium]